MDLNTKYGKARINEKRYYKIITSKEGNYGKSLHRLIFEDVYGEIPKGYDIHHKNGDKLDNCILNLQLIRHDKHASLHHKNKKVSRETIEKRIQSTTKKYARIVKNGHEKNKQRYCILHNGVKIKGSVDKKKLLNWFLKEHPLEIIKMGV